MHGGIYVPPTRKIDYANMHVLDNYVYMGLIHVYHATSLCWQATYLLCMIKYLCCMPS